MNTFSQKPINFIIGNHKPCVVTGDAFEYIVQGVRQAGGAIQYSLGDYRGDCVNVIMEGCKIGTAKSFSEMRRKYPASRLYMIVTEILTDHGFNSANTVHTLDGEHYSDFAYWDERSRGFHTLAPQLDGLIFLAESLFEGYARLKLPTHYLPLVALPGYLALEREPEPKRDIDIYFSGTVTDYRAKVLHTLEEEGFQVFQQSPQYPEYLRRHFLARSKLAVGLRLAENTQFTSKQRAHYYLINRIPHVFETTPDETDLHKFIKFAKPGDEFVEKCFDILNDESVFPHQVFDEFRKSPKFNSTNVFHEFLEFLSR